MRAKLYKCDDCGAQAEFTSYNKARRQGGWAVSKDYKKCYCPKCAPTHRMGNAQNSNTPKLASGGQQLGIEGI